MSTDKARQAQIKRLEVQLKKPENKECFDCTSKQPRWASTNLGIFMCLRCAGIHRSLGVHITKVKSTTMDAWEEHMIRTAERIGNGRGKEIYEARYTGKKPDVNCSSQEIERHIRLKFESKAYYATNADELFEKYMAEDTSAKPASTPLSQPSISTAPRQQPQQQSTPQQAHHHSGASGMGMGVDWGGFESATPTSSSNASPATVPTNTAKQTSSNGGGDFWETFGSSTATASASPMGSHHQPQGTPAGMASAGFGDWGSLQTAADTQTTGNNGGNHGGKSDGESLMTFKPTNSQAPSRSSGNSSDTSDIMAAFGSRPSGGPAALGGNGMHFPPPIRQQPALFASPYQHYVAPGPPGYQPQQQRIAQQQQQQNINFFA